MEKRKSAIILILLVLLVFGTAVSASTLTFIDSAYIGNGTLTISQINGVELTVLHNLGTYTLENTTGYVLKYQPAGFVQLNQEGSGFNFYTLYFILAYFSNPIHLLVLFVLIFLFLVGVGVV